MLVNNFKKDIANRTRDLMKIPGSYDVINNYEKGYCTLKECITTMLDMEEELKSFENLAALGETTGFRFIYGMRVRGCSTAAQPDDGFIQIEDNNGYTDESGNSRYHDIISYRRKLTEDEIRHFSLDYLGVVQEVKCNLFD